MLIPEQYGIKSFAVSKTKTEQGLTHQQTIEQYFAPTGLTAQHQFNICRSPQHSTVPHNKLRT